MTIAHNHPLIRPATVEDAIALGPLHVSTWQAAYRGIVPDAVLNRLDANQRQSQFRQAIATQQGETYVLEIGAEILGFLTLGAARDADLEPDTTGEIWGIYIAPTYWRRGFGSRLLSYAEQKLRDRAYSQAVLWVLAENQAARAFYEAWGFYPDAHIKEIPWQPPTTAVRYRKSWAEDEAAKRFS